VMGGLVCAVAAGRAGASEKGRSVNVDTPLILPIVFVRRAAFPASGCRALIAAAGAAKPPLRSTEMLRTVKRPWDGGGQGRSLPGLKQTTSYTRLRNL
jgi:hypothetical protein